MLSTLYVRAQESRRADALVRDPWAEDLVARIDYDFKPPDWYFQVMTLVGHLVCRPPFLNLGLSAANGTLGVSTRAA